MVYVHGSKMISLKTLTYSVTWAIMDNDTITEQNNTSRCPSYSEEFKNNVRSALYIKGIVQIVLAILGIVGNIMMSVIISHKQSRSTFNMLVVTLGRCSALL